MYLKNNNKKQQNFLRYFGETFCLKGFLRTNINLFDNIVCCSFLSFKTQNYLKICYLKSLKLALIILLSQYLKKKKLVYLTIYLENKLLRIEKQCFTLWCKPIITYVTVFFPCVHRNVKKVQCPLKQVVCELVPC